MTVRVGSDPRAVRHRARPGAESAGQLAQRPQVAVVGGGIAGLAAATGLAERGVGVTLIERAPYLGGRVGGWSESLPDGTQVAVNRGFHAFFRQYYNLRQLLARTDPNLDRLTPVEDYPLLDAHGRLDSFRGLPRTPPWSALRFALRSPTFTVPDLMRIDARAAAPLADVSVPEIYHRLDHIDAATFLQRMQFPAAARHLAFEVFSRSFFASPGAMSAAELAAMFHIYFLGSAEGLLFDVPTANYDTALWNPLGRYLSDLGVDICLDTTVTAVETGGPRTFRLHHRDDAVLDVDAVVLALDTAGLRTLVEASPDLGDEQWRTQIARLRTAPPFLVHRLWLDRPVAAHRAPFLGTGGLAPLDNISVPDRYEHEAATWARRNDGAVVELHAYALPEDIPSHDTHLRPAELTAQLVQRLHEVYPETATARIVAEHTQRRSDCPLFGVGDFAHRPPVHTPHPRLMLAGDLVRIDLPVALMERAATTGLHAANCLLATWELVGHDLYTVPTRGRNTVLRWLAATGNRQT
ncbi:FAD-dependent oxidoreductase [Rhodococcus sp. NPDC060090]|uniref:FAD-dependent oxidoreductase n=1 Tax=Rhodococcus sp. NPDC060090 TaxID=3347056 RepID=UPI00366A1AE5